MIPQDLLKKVRRIELRTARLVDDVLAGGYHSAFKGRGMEFEEVRQYQVGDDVRTIDWNVSARYGEPFVKLYREERELTVILLVDVSGSQHFGTHEQFKDELVAEICATLSISAIRNNDKVGLICFSDRIETYIPPRKGSKHVLRVIRELLAIKPEGKGTDIGSAIEFLNKVQKKRSIVFLVSDMQNRNWQKQLQIANRRHDVVAVSTNDISETQLPIVGLMRIENPETGELHLLDTSSKRVRRAWVQLANEREIAIEQTLRRSKVDQIKVKTGEPFTGALRQFFQRREARRA
ncbi:MAG TPA: DUF58 domain-containing protein [Phycisphaerales bacterium]|nr:DUF58 domain-containing protein [Phycisphaerales bacterium]HIN83489.1 DUF58 domain-containing protein [Phycisphaerales bacterium]